MVIWRLFGKSVKALVTVEITKLDSIWHAVISLDFDQFFFLMWLVSIEKVTIAS